MKIKEMKENELLITDIQRFSLNDGPGIRTTVFFKGCPMRCFWCHNPETQSAFPEIMYDTGLCIKCRDYYDLCSKVFSENEENGEVPANYDKCVFNCPTKAIIETGSRLSTEELVRLIISDRDYYDTSGGGVTFSGGEPLSQIYPLAKAMEICSSEGIHTAVDTAGFVPFSSFVKILQFTDLFLYDIKLIDNIRHRAGTGVENSLILENFRKLTELTDKVIVRVPLVPGFNDTAEDISAIAEFSADNGVTRVDILPYHGYAAAKYRALGRIYEAADLVTPCDNKVEELAETVRRFVYDVRIEQH